MPTPCRYLHVGTVMNDMKTDFGQCREYILQKVKIAFGLRHAVEDPRSTSCVSSVPAVQICLLTVSPSRGYDAPALDQTICRAWVHVHYTSFFSCHSVRSDFLRFVSSFYPGLFAETVNPRTRRGYPNLTCLP